MDKIKCVEDKGYKITTDKEYDIVKQDRDYYFIENDNQKVARYRKSLFEEVRAAPVRTERNMIESITWDEETRRVSFINMNLQPIRIDANLTHNTTSISCGVHQVSAIDGVCAAIAHAVTVDNDYINLQKALLARILQEDLINRHTTTAMYLMSTAVDNIGEDMISTIESIASVTSEVRRNPNSGNNIKTWIFYTRA